MLYSSVCLIQVHMVELQVEAGIYLHVVIQYSNESKKDGVSTKQSNLYLNQNYD